MLGVLVLAGYAIHLGSPVVAGILGVVDVISLAAVFNGNNRAIAHERHQEATD